MGAGECSPGLIELPAGNPRRRRRLAPWPSGTLERWPAGAESVSPPGCPGPGHCSTVPACHRPGEPLRAAAAARAPGGSEPGTPHGTHRELAVAPRVEANAKLQIVMPFFGLR